MIRRIRPILTSVSLIALAAPAAAQITVDDVWRNFDAAVAAFGGTSEATLTRAGSEVTVSGHEMRFAFPMGLGEAWVRVGDYKLIEADGAVSLVYPSVIEMSAGAEIVGEGSGEIFMEMHAGDYVTVATGEPGAISYTSSGDRLEVYMTDIVADGLSGLDLTGSIVMESYYAESRIIEDKLIVIYSRSEVGETITEYEITDGMGFFTESRAVNGPTVSTANVGLIPGGANILNLSQALRDGMYISIDVAGAEAESYTYTSFDGRMEQEQDYATAGNEMSMRLDRDALEVSGTVRGLLFNMVSTDFGMPNVGFDADEIGMGFRMPLLSSPAPQDFGYDLSLDALRLGPSIWALFDPDKVLPRGPASLDLDLGGQMILGADLPDLLALPELGGRQDVPIQVTAIDIARFAFSALGITADSEGTFELDYENYSMIPGVPWPRGSGRAEVEGLNGAIDRFVELGLIGSDEVLGLRMMISLGTVVAGDDRLTSEIEFTEDGGIIANGQPLR